MTLHPATESVSDRVRAVLESQERSGRWLARRLNKTHAWAHRRLSGEVDWSAEDLQRTAEALGVPVASFFGERAA